MTPTVNEPDNPNGFPIATAVSPTSGKVVLRVKGCTSVSLGFNIFRTARSLKGSLPTKDASYALPFRNVTIYSLLPKLKATT